MKEGWKTVSLGSVTCKSDNINWKSIDKDKCFLYVDLTSVDRKLLKITDSQEIDLSNAPSRAQRIIKENDIIFATTRPTLRRLCIIPANFNNQICSTGFCVLRPKDNILSSWIFYSLIDESFYKYIEPLQSGATYPAVTDKAVKGYMISLPSLPEQQRIVDILDAEFAKIDALKANAEKNLQNAKDLFQAALKKELEPKEGWKEYTLKDVCTINPSKSEARKNNIKEESYVSFLPMEDMTIGEMNVYPSKTKLFKTVVGSYTYFIEDDLLLAKVTPCFENGKNGIVRNLKNGIGFGSSEYIVLRANNQRLLIEYLYFYVNTNNFKLTGKKQMLGACGLKRLSKDYVKESVIYLPDLTLQKRIIQNLVKLSSNCKQLQSNYEKTIALCDDMKQALLRKAFNGEL